jgi:hypothetical protein
MPLVQAVVPPSGPSAGGTPVTLFGSDFRPGLNVFFGGAEATVLQVSTGTVRVLTPVYPAGPAPLKVRNGDGTHAIVENGFTFTGGPALAPEILGASLALGPPAGGGSFLLWGRNFLSGATVTVGGAAASPTIHRHAGLIEAVAPPGAAGWAAVVVQNPGGPSVTLISGYWYLGLGPTQGIVAGRAEYEKRQVLPMGLSGSVVPTPIPYASVEIHVETSPPQVYTLDADRWGYFAEVVTTGADARIRVNARTSAGSSPVPLRIMDNPTDQALYAVETLTFPIASQATTRRDVLALADGPFGVAGAFNILAVCSHAARRVSGVLGASLPTLHAFWEPGNATTVETSSYFFVDLGAGPVPVLQILGGVQWAEEYTDTDEFDDTLIAHEFGHFVQSTVSTDGSPGGRHGGERLVPNLAFSEGFADWFGCATTGASVYRDTTGRGDWGFVQVEFTCESVGWQFPLVKGIGSESTVLELLWDLYDGVPEAADEDADGVALGYAPVLESLAGFDPNFDFPSLYTLFDQLVANAHVTGPALDALARGPEEQDVPYPEPPSSAFPIPLGKGVSVRDFVDARTPYHPPDPSWKFWLLSSRGNPHNPLNGFNSRRYFRFTLPAQDAVTLTLSIEGTGRWPENLDLYLLDLRNGVIAASQSTGSSERIQTTLAAGTYIVEVRGYQELGMGYVQIDAANFTLTLE